MNPRGSTMGCAEVLNTTRRTWLRLVGRRHDVQLWDVDTRVPILAYKRPYTGRETGGEGWISAILERIRMRYSVYVRMQSGVAEIPAVPFPCCYEGGVPYFGMRTTLRGFVFCAGNAGQVLRWGSFACPLLLLLECGVKACLGLCCVIVCMCVA